MNTGKINIEIKSMDIYARDVEDCDCLASTYAFDSEAEEMREEIENEMD